jgi:hypothetical protein
LLVVAGFAVSLALSAIERNVVDTLASTFSGGLPSSLGAPTAHRG